MHVPHHDEKALHCVVQVIDWWKPDRVLFLGDGLDAEAFSVHGLKSMAERRAHKFIDDEVALMNWVVDYCQGSKLNTEFVYIEGNHEYRIERFALSINASIGDAVYKLLSPKRLITNRMDQDGIEQGRRKNFKWIPHMPKTGIHSHYKLTKDCIAVHGWSIAKHAAMQHLALARSVSIVHGHTHRMQHVMSRDPLSGKPIHAWSPGCLSKLTPLFMAHNPNDWTQGLSLMYEGEDSWTSYDVNIHKGFCVLPDGTQIYADKSWRLKDML